MTSTTMPDGSIVDGVSLRFSPEYRSGHIGASQWPVVCGVDPYQEPIDLFGRFTGVMPWDDFSEPNEAIELGHALEDGVAKVAARKLGQGCRPCATLEHPLHPWACATPDRILDNGDSLQVKTTRLTNPSRVYREEWGEEGTDEVPPRVLCQVTAEMFVARAWAQSNQWCACERTHVAALIPGRGVAMFLVEYDEEFASMMFERVQAFWHAVRTRTQLPVDDTEAFSQFLTARYPSHESGKWIEADAAMEADARHLAKLRDKLDKLEAEERATRNGLCARIADAEGIRGSFGKIAWRGVRGREQLNVPTLLDVLRQKFGADVINPLVQQNTARGSGHRRFALTLATEKK